MARVWNVSRLTNPIGMFDGATAFNVDISGWSTGSIVNMQEMFKNASSFSAPIGSWDVADVWNFTDVFDGATAFWLPAGAPGAAPGAGTLPTATAAQASINDSSSSWASNPNWSAPW